MSIARIKVSSHLATPSCGGRGVLTSAFYMAWMAEKFSSTGIKYTTIMFRTEDLVEESTGKRGLYCVQERHTECDELSSCRSREIILAEEMVLVLWCSCQVKTGNNDFKRFQLGFFISLMSANIEIYHWMLPSLTLKVSCTT